MDIIIVLFQGMFIMWFPVLFFYRCLEEWLWNEVRTWIPVKCIVEDIHISITTRRAVRGPGENTIYKHEILLKAFVNEKDTVICKQYNIEETRMNSSKEFYFKGQETNLYIDPKNHDRFLQEIHYKEHMFHKNLLRRIKLMIEGIVFFILLWYAKDSFALILFPFWFIIPFLMNPKKDIKDCSNNKNETQI